jgi:subtilase family serine protease
METSLDTEWAHATAPMADILLVETQSASISSLIAGVDAAVDRGAHAVSMSWGGPEFATETNYDRHFRKVGVSFLASSGDEGAGQSYPAASPNVLSVGGTTLVLDANGALLKSEKGWPGSGGGVSAYEKQPAYQATLAIQGNGKRTGPDISFDADPSTGVAVYASADENGAKGGWFTIGGTSAAAPQWAGIIALIDEKRPSNPLSTNTLAQSFVYSAAALAGNFRDIKSGKNGTCGANCRAAAGYDLVTGLGSPLLPSLAPYLWGKYNFILILLNLKPFLDT